MYHPMNIAFPHRPEYLSVYLATWPNANFSLPLLWLPTGNIPLSDKSRVGGDLHLEFKREKANSPALLLLALHL